MRILVTFQKSEGKVIASFPDKCAYRYSFQSRNSQCVKVFYRVVEYQINNQTKKFQTKKYYLDEAETNKVISILYNPHNYDEGVTYSDEEIDYQYSKFSILNHFIFYYFNAWRFLKNLTLRSKYLCFIKYECD